MYKMVEDKSLSQAMTIKLKECPFCGNSEETALPTIEPPHICNYKGRVCIHCGDCGAFVFGKTIEDAIKRWNTRPREEVLQVRNTQLCEALTDVVLIGIEHLVFRTHIIDIRKLLKGEE